MPWTEQYLAYLLKETVQNRKLPPKLELFRYPFSLPDTIPIPRLRVSADTEYWSDTCNLGVYLIQLYVQLALYELIQLFYGELHHI